MGQKTVENLVIVLLVIAIIYMLFRNNLNGNKKNSDKRVAFAEKNQEIKLDQKLMEEFTEDKQDKKNLNEDDVPGHDWIQDYEELDKFVSEYKDYGRFAKGNQGLAKGNEMEINAYRKSFLDFRNYTNNTSNGFDAVDNMNLEKLQDESKGMKISEVYDRISANNYKESNVDIVGMLHNEKVDNTIRTNEFRYDSDTVNNGAPFFNNVIGYDNRSYEAAL
jgi:competence protein ComGC